VIRLVDQDDGVGGRSNPPTMSVTVFAPWTAVGLFGLKKTSAGVPSTPPRSSADVEAHRTDLDLGDRQPYFFA
jgi:hypothetical protein